MFFKKFPLLILSHTLRESFLLMCLHDLVIILYAFCFVIMSFIYIIYVLHMP